MDLGFGSATLFFFQLCPCCLCLFKDFLQVLTAPVQIVLRLLSWPLSADPLPEFSSLLLPLNYILFTAGSKESNLSVSPLFLLH